MFLGPRSAQQGVPRVFLGPPSQGVPRVFLGPPSHGVPRVFLGPPSQGVPRVFLGPSRSVLRPCPTPRWDPQPG